MMRFKLHGLLYPLVLASTLILNQAAWSQTSAVSLDCDIGDQQQETKLLRAANGMAVRRSIHELRLTVAGKELTFKDTPPYDEPLDGTSYTYCGRKEGYSLIADREGDVFTGKLIDERTGRILDAGQEVMFSPDRRAYLASEQIDGMDGPMWTIHSIDGKVSWKGPSFVEPSTPHSSAISLDSPAWTASGELVAKVNCSANNELAKLVKINGAWKWRLPPSCKAGAQ